MDGVAVSIGTLSTDVLLLLLRREVAHYTLPPDQVLVLTDALYLIRLFLNFCKMQHESHKLCFF